ncbi:MULTISPECIES: cytochrome b [unclassified Burkholderia]|uniref:cytochrome b n=1 Tax=unclassified Burkholderia TaxID=2613784 RepID=UPI000F560131|nr:MULTISPECIES: cytochrome b [unclassified Burkholderia]RQR34220.1 cytochrome b [Burkholderia sp. Bp9142]RQR53019.1 cytochrome b [Burkholderia sp. Bp9140]
MTTRIESPPIALDGAQAPSQYTRTAMVLHWTIAVLMIGNAALGLSADSLSDGWVRPVIDTHKSIGITVLGLALMRILWRVSHRPPPLPREFPSWERVAAHVAHFLLYLLMIALPLSGWAHDSAWKDALTHPMRLFNLFPWPRIGFVMNLVPSVKEPLHTGLGTLHTWLGYALYALLAMHIGGALKHQWLDRQSVFKRMAP